MVFLNFKKKIEFGIVVMLEVEVFLDGYFIEVMLCIVEKVEDFCDLLF